MGYCDFVQRKSLEATFCSTLGNWGMKKKQKWPQKAVLRDRGRTALKTEMQLYHAIFLWAKKALFSLVKLTGRDLRSDKCLIYSRRTRPSKMPSWGQQTWHRTCRSSGFWSSSWSLGRILYNNGAWKGSGHLCLDTWISLLFFREIWIVFLGGGIQDWIKCQQECLGKETTLNYESFLFFPQF